MDILLDNLSDDEDLRFDDSAENLDPVTSSPPRGKVNAEESLVNVSKPSSSFTFLPTRKSSPSRTSRLYDDAAGRTARLEKKRTDQWKKESKGMFQPDLQSSAKKRAKSLAGMLKDLDNAGECVAPRRGVTLGAHIGGSAAVSRAWDPAWRGMTTGNRRSSHHPSSL